mmetsp:Transcript_80979/g.215008  ORF Transcript_80979/g.215008 Transcript_80979/m.215008 type:complete len:234 (+) Transcript_80979:803-1504(+)
MDLGAHVDAGAADGLQGLLPGRERLREAKVYELDRGLVQGQPGLFDQKVLGLQVSVSHEGLPMQVGERPHQLMEEVPGLQLTRSAALSEEVEDSSPITGLHDQAHLHLGLEDLEQADNVRVVALRVALDLGAHVRDMESATLRNDLHDELRPSRLAFDLLDTAKRALAHLGSDVVLLADGPLLVYPIQGHPSRGEIRDHARIHGSSRGRSAHRNLENLPDPHGAIARGANYQK